MNLKDRLTFAVARLVQAEAFTAQCLGMQGVDDPELIKEAEQALKEVNELLEEIPDES